MTKHGTATDIAPDNSKVGGDLLFDLIEDFDIDPHIISLMFKQCLVEPPSQAYAQSVHGAPTKPTSVVLPSVSFRRFFKVWATNGNCEEGSNFFASASNWATRSALRGVSSI